MARVESKRATKGSRKRRRNKCATLKAHSKPIRRVAVELKEPSLPVFRVVCKNDSELESKFSRDLMKSAVDDDVEVESRVHEPEDPRRGNRFAALCVKDSDDDEDDEEDLGELKEGLIKKPNFFGIAAAVVEASAAVVEEAEDDDDL